MKKLIATVLSAAAFCSSFSAMALDYGEEYKNQPDKQTVQRFSDVPLTHWAFDYIGEMAQREVIDGYLDGRFLPENQVTRAEFAKIMVCAAGLRVSNTTQTSFTDVYISDWYCPYIECAKEYLTGYSTDSGMVYKPTTPALREDIAVALVKLKGYDTSVADESILNMFSDSYSISDSAKKYVAVAVERGLVSGYDDYTFKGQATITRAEAATLLWRAFQYGSDNKVTSVNTDTSQNTSSQTTSAPQTTNDPKVTNKPIETQKPVVTQKSYKIDTLKSVNLDSPVAQSTYDGENIYYLSGTTVYQMDPYTGKTSSIYDASQLTFQIKEMQDKEVTKTVTRTVPIEETNDGSTEEQSAETDKTTDENTDSTEQDETAEQPETMEIEEEVTEIVQEEVVVKEYSSYKPTQIIYDKYNDRLIMNGYYSHAEELFKLPNDNAKYRIAYDITNDEVYIEGLSDNINCFVDKNKFVSNRTIYDIEADTQQRCMPPAIEFYWTFNNNLYYKSWSGSWSYSSWRICQYDFSGTDKEIADLKCDYIGIKEGDVYYTDSNMKKIYKLSLSTGKIDELSITSDIEKCNVLDMASVRLTTDFIPVSDERIVFYDTSAKAFRYLSKN